MQSAIVVGDAVGAGDGPDDGFAVGLAVGVSDGSALGRGDGIALGVADGHELGSVDGAALGDSDGTALGASVLSQHPKYRIAPVCGEMPGQHWPESCMARHFG